MPEPEERVSKKPAKLLGLYILIAFVVAAAILFVATRKHDAGQATAIEQTR